MFHSVACRLIGVHEAEKQSGRDHGVLVATLHLESKDERLIEKETLFSNKFDFILWFVIFLFKYFKTLL